MSRSKSGLNLSHARNFIAALHDAAMAAISFLISLYVRLGSEQWHLVSDIVAPTTALFSLVCIGVFFYMRQYRGLWRYASMQDMIVIVKSVTLAILIFAMLMFLFNRLELWPRSALFINWMLLITMLGGPRFVYRAMRDKTLSLKTTLTSVRQIPVLLIGSGDQAEQFIRDMARDTLSPYKVVGMIDNNPERKGRTIHRVPIYGGVDLLPTILRKLERKGFKPQKIILADEQPGTSVRHILETVDSLGYPLARLPRLSDFKQNVSERLEVRPIAVEDLLGRPQNVLDRDSMQRLIEGKRVLVTGAGGTIGGELTRQVASFKPSELVLLELSEFNLYQIEREIRTAHPGLKLSVVLCDVRDTRHMDVIFRQYHPQLVFHAAAIKHVPMAEVNIEETILTNVYGTRYVAEACQKHGAEAMLMISTDKAVNPANVMGAAKRLAESYCQALGAEARSAGKTKFVTVRLGNVLGSTGSVVPLFTEQLARGGPLTVTHPDMVRYFMTVREAVELVLQAMVLGVQMRERQECIFVLDMGQPVRILDLAVQMIKLAGFKPYEDIKINFTGLRPGEKLYEELFHFSENAVKTTHESIFLSQPRFADMASLRQSLDPLLIACAERRTDDALALLKKLVPEFQHALN